MTLLFLFTNDDGVSSSGLWELVREASRIPDSEVVAVAPDRERSAASHSISIHVPIEVTEVCSTPRVKVYAASGTPADCVRLALDAFVPRTPDVLVSGINRGPNLGLDVFYSGTVSAAYEGALNGIPAIAVSTVSFEEVDYSLAARFSLELARLMVSGRLGVGLLNVNVPALSGGVSGVAVTKLSTEAGRHTFTRRVDPRGRVWFWRTRPLLAKDVGIGTDEYAVSQGLISVTPLRLDLVDSSAEAKLQGNVEDCFRKVLGPKLY